MTTFRFPPGERFRRLYYRRLADPFEHWTVNPVRRLKNRSRQYEPVFIAGAMGSGTSLLALSLGQEVDCSAVIHESALQVHRKSFLRVAPPARFSDVAGFLRHLDVGADWSIEAGRADLLHLYRSYAKGDCDVVIDKGPNTNLLRAGFLSRCFPASRFVFLFRDPVANIEGFRRKWVNFRADSLTASIGFYKEIHEVFLSATEKLGERVVAVEYEALVEDPRRILATLRDALSLRPAHESRKLRPRGNFEGQGIRNVARNRITIIRDANARAFARVEAETVSRIRKTLEPLYMRMRARALASGVAVIEQENPRQ